MSQDLVAGHQRECMMPNPKKPNAAGAVCLLLGCLLLGGCQALSGVATTQNSDSNDTSLFQAEPSGSDHSSSFDPDSFMQGFNGSPEP